MATDETIYLNGDAFKVDKDAIIEETDQGRFCIYCDSKCSGFLLHPWRNSCKNCNCPRELHDILLPSPVNLPQRLALRSLDNQTSDGAREKAFKMGYSWIPFGLEKLKVDDYMHQLDNNKIPRINSEGENHRTSQLILQLPRQDMSKRHARHLKTEEQNQGFEDFSLTRALFLDVAIIKTITDLPKQCNQCEGELQYGDLSVVASKHPEPNFWHPACFTCSVCNELLVDLCYFSKDGEIFCERHFAELFRPRCAACDELIFSGEYTKAMDQDWHNGHFACNHCDLNLTGLRYVLRENHPYCIDCYERLFAHMCHDCKKVIGTDSKDLSYKELHWHEKCFKCFDCHLSLVDKPFATTNNKLYCADCHDNNFAPKCDKCSKVFKSGMKKYDYNEKQYHLECFCCNECHQPIADQSFVPRDQVVVCVPCYEKLHAQRCFNCKGVLSKGGVAYKDNAYHRECFVCEGCHKPLAGEKFVAKEMHPFCVECFNDKFAKKCYHCKKPISGSTGNTKYVTFEEKQWHSDCFNCQGCGQSLVGQGFVLDSDQILCSKCIK